MGDISSNDILLLSFVVTLISLLIGISLFFIYHRKKIKVDKFMVFYVVSVALGVSFSTAGGIVAFVNGLCFLREGHPYQNAPINTIQPYMLYVLISVMFLIFAGFFGVYAVAKSFLLKEEPKNK